MINTDRRLALLTVHPNDFLGQSERSSLMTLILKSDMELKVKKQIYQKEPDNKQKQ